MTRVALIRPGSSDYDKQDRIQGKLSLPLSEADGREEAVATASQLALELAEAPLEVVYAAACEPAGATAEVIARELGIKAKKVEALTNVDCGLWEGCLTAEVRRKHPKVFRQWQELAENVCPPEGETLGQARQRIAPILNRLLRKHRRTTIALVAPSPLIELIGECLHQGINGTRLRASRTFDQWELLFDDLMTSQVHQQSNYHHSLVPGNRLVPGHRPEPSNNPDLPGQEFSVTSVNNQNHQLDAGDSPRPDPNSPQEIVGAVVESTLAEPANSIAHSTHTLQAHSREASSQPSSEN